MAWILPAIGIITSVVGGIAGQNNANAQTAKANANNEQQQQQQILAAQNQATLINNEMAPWLAKGASPLGNATSGPAPGPLSLGSVPGQSAGAPQPPAPAVMQPPQGPAQPQPQRRAPQQMGAQPGAPPAQPPKQQITPMQLAQIQQIMRAPQPLNTTPVAL